MPVVPALHARGNAVPQPEYVSRFLLTVQRRGQRINVGAVVDGYGQIVILVPEDLPLSMHEATELQKKIREAVLEASMREF